MIGAKYIIIAGVLIVMTGILLYFFPDAFKWIGRLPGDIRIKKGNNGFYFPVVTMMVISIIITVLFKIIRKLL